MNTLSSLLEFIGNRISTYDTKIDNGGVVQVTKASVSSLPTTITDSAIKADHVAIEAVLSNPAAQKSNWTVTTSSGSLTISGTISGTTDVTILLASKVN